MNPAYIFFFNLYSPEKKIKLVGNRDELAPVEPRSFEEKVKKHK